LVGTALAAPRMRHLSRGLGAAAAQGCYSLANLVVGVTVARSLGPAALGHFAFLFTLLTAFVAVQTAWVGDSLTVLNRQDADLRRSLVNAQWAHCLLGGGVAGVIAYLAGGIGVSTAAVFASLVAAWELEEFGRRVFMARLEFWKQAANDGSYLVLVTAALLMWKHLFGLTLTGALACMSATSLLAFALGMLALPSPERLGLPKLGRATSSVVARFGIWRGAQGAAGYASQVAVRSLVIAMASAATMGQLEAARLVLAPLFTVTAASGNLTLAGFARSGSNALERGSKVWLLRLSMFALALLALVYGAIVLMFPSAFVHLLAGHHFHADRRALGGWLLVVLATSVGTPLSSFALARKRAAAVLWTRLGGSAIGLALAAGALAVTRPTLVPLALGIGAAAGSALLWRHAVS